MPAAHSTFRLAPLLWTNPSSPDLVPRSWLRPTTTGATTTFGFFAGEVKDPGKTIPRALLISIVAVAAIYIVMNISILGVMSWRELEAASKSDTRFYVVSTMMQRLYGHRAGVIAAVLVM